MKSSRDILLFVDSSTFGGIETHLLQLASGLVASGQQVKVVFFKDYGPHPLGDALKEQNIPVIFLRWGGFSLLTLLTQTRPALLHSHGYKAGILGRLACSLLRIPSIHTHHAGESCTGKLALYAAIDNKTAFLNTENIAVSEAISARLSAKNTVFNNFVDAQNLTISQGQKVAFVGRLSEEKGPDRFITLAKKHAHLAFSVYGDGPLRAPLEQQATPNCRFHGRVNMDEHWQDIGFLIICSRYEGLPLVALEAMARGIIVISFAVGDMSKLITHEIDGYLMAEGDMDELAHALDTATQTKEAAIQYIRQNAILRVQQHYSTQAVLPQYIDLYQRATQNSLTKNRRILIVHYGEEWIRGSEVCLLELVRRLIENHWTPIVWCNAKTLADALEPLDVKVIRSRFTLLAGWQAPKFDLWNYGQLTREATRIIKENHIDIIHTNNGAPNQWVIPAAKKIGVPVLCQLHSPYQFRDRVSLLLNEADALVGVSRAVIEPFLAQTGTRHKTRVIHNGIQLNQGIAPTETLKRTLGIDANAITLISVGSLIERKGFDLLIQAQVLTNQQIHLIIVGGGPELNTLQQLSQQLNVSDRVHFLGERQDVNQLLRGGHTAFVSGAREEAFGLVLAEAGLAKLPVIAPNVGGIPEVLDQGRAGILVAPNNPEALAQAINQLVASTALQDQLANALYQRVLLSFDSHANAQKLCDTYEQLIEQQKKNIFHNQAWVELHVLCRVIVSVAHKTFSRMRAH